MSSNSRFGCFGIFVIIMLCLSLLMNLVFIAGGVLDGGGSEHLPDFRENTLIKAEKGVVNKIAVIRLAGVISGMRQGHVGETMVEDIKLQLKQALEDEDVKAIVMEVDSPGGEVTASDIIYEAVKKAVAKKPVVISMGSMAASGGYYVACGGSYIFAHDTTFTGSIGVIIQSLNYTELLGKVGLEMVTFKSGKFKDMLSGSRKMTPEESEYLQAMIMQTYGKFVGIVAASRKLDEAVLREGVADGRVLSGADALKEKLVDGIGGIEEAVDKARELGKAPGAAAVRYEARAGLAKIFRMLETAEPKKVEVSLGTASEIKLEPGRIYLLPSVLVP